MDERPATDPVEPAPDAGPTANDTPTTEKEPTMGSTEPERTSAWTTDTSTDTSTGTSTEPDATGAADTLRLDEPVAPAAAAPAPPVSPAIPVATVPFPRTLDEPRGVRVGTVVWGLVVVAVAVGLVALANGAVFDWQLATIVTIAGAGLALLVGSLLGARRRTS